MKTVRAPGPKEAAQRALREGNFETAPPARRAAATKAIETGNARAAAAVERKSAKKAKKTKATKKTAPATAAERPDGLRVGSKMATMIDMALRPEGATEKAICKKLGWVKCRVTLTRTADRVGAKLTKVKDEKTGETTFFATLPK